MACLALACFHVIVSNTLLHSTNPPWLDRCCIYLSLGTNSLESGRNLADANKEVLNVDWLTPGLVEEIEQQFPVANEIDSTNPNQPGNDFYLTKIAIIFPLGRKFASFKQLIQACEMFLEA